MNSADKTNCTTFTIKIKNIESVKLANMHFKFGLLSLKAKFQSWRRYKEELYKIQLYWKNMSYKDRLKTLGLTSLEELRKGIDLIN